MGRPASVVIPTRSRPDYLRVALAGVMPQAAALGTDVLVVIDGPAPGSEAAARDAGARVVAHDRTRGLNAARNTGIAETDGELVCFLDDDVEVRDGWLETLIEGAAREPDVDCFTGPIFARIEDHAFTACGREGPPITAMDLGPVDTNAAAAWGANLAIRRSAFADVGLFDEGRELYGDEQEWEDRLRAGARPRIRYLTGAALDHRRAGDDARLPSLMKAALARGRASRRFDHFRGDAPSPASEVRTLLATIAHGPRYRCAMGPVMAAHSWGRVEVGLRHSAGTDAGADAVGRDEPSTAPPAPPIADFLSGTSGTVGGRRGTVRRIADRALDLVAAHAPTTAARRSVLVLSIVRPGRRDGLWAATRRELEDSAHDVTIVTSVPAARGKFENLDALLADVRIDDYDWLVIVDDDIVLPVGFLDGLLGGAEALGLKLVQPAHRLHSHAAWSVTRRRPGVLARETAFVEIGPVTAFARETFSELLPFPAELGMGWGLDVHWAAIARDRGWPIGIVDAVPILHAHAPAGDAYSREAAEAQARAFLADRPYLPRDEANRTLRTVRRA